LFASEIALATSGAASPVAASALGFRSTWYSTGAPPAALMRPSPGVPANPGTTRESTNCRSAVCESTRDVRPYETTGSAFGLTITASMLRAAGISPRSALIACSTACKSTRGSVCGSKSTTISAEPCVDVARTRVADGSV
jgi:hypothetical protein